MLLYSVDCVCSEDLVDHEETCDVTVQEFVESWVGELSVVVHRLRSGAAVVAADIKSVELCVVFSLVVKSITVIFDSTGWCAIQ